MSGGNFREAKELLAQAAQCDMEEIPDDASINNWDGWTSLVHMRLILAIETVLNQELPPDAVIGIATLDDVSSYLKVN